MPIYLECSDFDGSVSAGSFDNCIKLESAQFSIDTGDHYYTNERKTNPKISDFIVTSVIDNSAIAILKSALSYRYHDLIKVHFTRTGAGGEDKAFMSYELTDCAIIKYSMASVEGADPLITMCLGFTKMTYKYLDIDASGIYGGQQVLVHDQSGK